MSRNELLLFKKETDAVGSNRGFIYQYLKTLVVWLKNYKEKKDIKIYCEVEDDIKEFDSQLKKVKYTQLKCYSSVLSLKHEDVQKSLYNFFVLFLIYDDYDGTFSFETNTAISTKDKLLADWALNEGRLELDTDLLEKCISETQEILINQFKIETTSYESKLSKQINNRQQSLSDETLSRTKKEKLTQEITELNNKLSEYREKAETISKKIKDKDTIKVFINRVQWKFSCVPPEDSMKALESEALQILESIIGKNKNSNIYFYRLFTEVSKKAVCSEIDNRVLDNQLLDIILAQTEDEIKAHISYSLIEELKKSFDESLTVGLDAVHAHLDKIEQKVDQISASNRSNNDSEEYTYVSLPHQEQEVINNFLDNEGNDYQSKLETKIQNMENVDDEIKLSLLEMGTEYRCKYLIHLEELKLNSSRAYQAVKILERKVQKICTSYTMGLKKVPQVDSNEFYQNLENKLEELLSDFNKEIIREGLKIDIDIVTGQMFHMAAKCSLRWNKEVKGI
ncbi:hypothetical protein [Thermaerobacillus caldiproteolyticus]|uniref:hypothetical protein n=1 Tax=Thermaerobacillus caldiproteolyticus TaxID=247480 RepID=UPI0018F1D7BB|nr:hypothetical protein [Anoxybacillus caldiproteolyticus]